MTQNPDSTSRLDAGSNPRVTYSEGGRSGTIHYKSTETSFDVWYELALSPALAIIGIPEPRYWEAQTKTPLSQRMPILQFIGDQVVIDQLQGDGYCLIDYDNIMTIYKGKNPNTI